ncbi:monothiol bacilliredoxin BrxC family protein [Leptolyngbya sp. 7M]|uniref:monothiol bacilliredoxin BrxC family protein n=1 Tax=Leptolyngbya sp. 7M TaxID=2812896 RepID=UPI001B8B6DED|nr:monothiol bacilliredoxin BrxC family protein [Leptolyngbya sp. 7M]QYO68107.1 DUF2847 family protein [Leptolyngbya sp. 7M]
MVERFKDICSVEELDRLFEFTEDRPIILFKHSNACGTSAYIQEKLSGLDAVIHRVIVQRHRDVSDEIARRTQTIHHTPQVIILRSNKLIYSASHYSISSDDIAAHLGTDRGTDEQDIFNTKSDNLTI